MFNGSRISTEKRLLHIESNDDDSPRVQPKMKFFHKTPTITTPKSTRVNATKNTSVQISIENDDCASSVNDSDSNNKVNNNNNNNNSSIDNHTAATNGNDNGKSTHLIELKSKESNALLYTHFILLSLVVIAAIAYIWFNMGWTYGLPACAAGLIAVLLLKPGWRWFYIAAVTTRRDTTALFAYIRVLLFMRNCQKQNSSIGDIFELNVAKHPDKLAVVSEAQKYTFRQLNEYANRIANVFHSHGYKKGDVVGLLVENRPEFVAIWLGLSKIGVITPLINTNLRGSALVHSITAGECTALIYSDTFAEGVAAIGGELPSHLALYQLHENGSADLLPCAKNLTILMMTAIKDMVSSGAIRPNHQDKLVYIYTSGTTGLPKAAVITHARFCFITAGIHYALGFQPKDVFYTPLPLYHTAGGVMSMGQALLFGSTVAIRKKFSASGYFSDCAKFDCTIAHYIGEMARYILATKPGEHDRNHKVRMVYGNGLRPQIWPQFVARFGIAKVGEFYGATEGNANIMNNDSTVGAIGFVSRIMPQVYPISIIRADPDTGVPIRNAKGLCQLCEPNEPGVFIGKIIKGNPAREFLGYVDSTASTKKIVHDVFKKGDMAFISGDLLISDERGYLYFKDRTGDTFRWKGENVSTSEVEAHVSNLAGYKDCIVYGVLVPHTEGRAGMAAIYDPNQELDLTQFAISLRNALPTYARPQFLRLLTKIDLTGTFKLRKVDLQRQGFDPSIISDPLFYLTPNGNYEPLNEDIFEKIRLSVVRI